MEYEDSHSKKQIFIKKLSQLEQFTEAEQKQKIEEMNEIVDGMNEEEFESIFREEPFDKINEMIEEEKLSMENTLLLLKHIGYCKVLFGWWIYGFEESQLNGRFEKMIEEKEKKEEEKDKTLLVDLCECYLSLHLISSEIGEIISIIVPCLLKAASVKEENDEAQKEVEMALLALCNISQYNEMETKLFLNEIREIIKYHQEHHNLTRLACQSAWRFLVSRLWADNSLEEIIVNKLHFGREARRELEELTKCANWKKKEEEMNKEEAKEEFALMRWLETSSIYFGGCQLQNEEFARFINSIVQVYRAAKDNHREISNQCIYAFQTVTNNSFVKIDEFLKSGVIDLYLEEMKQSTLDDKIMSDCLYFFLNISKRLKAKEKDEMEEARRKSIKMEVFEKMEEEGYEDIIASFHGVISIRFKYYRGMSINISDYFVNI